MKRRREEQLDAVFRALADSTRRMILEELSARREQSLFELCVRLVEKRGRSLSRQAISKHLAVLEDAGLLTTSWSGRTKLHSSTLGAHAPLVQRWISKNAE